MSSAVGDVLPMPDPWPAVVAGACAAISLIVHAEFARILADQGRLVERAVEAILERTGL